MSRISTPLMVMSLAGAVAVPETLKSTLVRVAIHSSAVGPVPLKAK